MIVYFDEYIEHEDYILAKKIPSFLRRNFFKNKFYYGELRALDGGIDELSESRISDSRKLHLLVCLLLFSNNSSLDIDSIVDFALTALNLGPEHIAIAATYTGRLEVVDKIRHQLSQTTLCSIFSDPMSLENLILEGNAEKFEEYLNFTLFDNVKVKDFLVSDDFSQFYQWACENGHLELVQHVEVRLGKEEILAAIRRENYDTYGMACRSGNLALLQYLEARLGEGDTLTAIREKYYIAYLRACRSGNLALLQHLEARLGESETLAAIKANSYLIYQWACEHGDLALLQHLEERLGEVKHLAAIRSYGHKACHLACQSGDLAMLKYLETRLGEEESFAEIMKYRGDAYRWAWQNNDLAMLQYLEARLGKAATLFSIRTLDYSAYREVCNLGDLALLQYLEVRLGEGETLVAIREKNYEAYRMACEHGDLVLLQHLEAQLGEDETLAAVKVDDYYAYQMACQGGHLELVKHLETQLGEDETLAAVKVDDYCAYQLACQKGDLELVYHLLNNSACLAYAEFHDQEYGKRYIYHHLKLKLLDLESQKLHFEQENPNGVFDLSPQVAQYAFYLLRNLIRRGIDRSYGFETRVAEDLSNEIRFLLSIPSVRTLCHQTVTVDENIPGQKNELLRLALRLDNATAAGMLMQIPAVRQMAEQNNFYRDELNGALDLRQFTQDAESSMVALSKPEQQLLDRALFYYQKTIDSMGGMLGAFERLKSELKRRYEESPAQLFLESSTGKAEAIDLPFEWSELQVLRTELTDEQYQSALSAYYQHDAHTAFRYLSKPNYWMDPSASYVYVFEGNGQYTPYRYSTFEEHMPLIVVSFVAAFDEDMPCIDGYSFDGRQNLFIKQVALTGRAHDWDDKRPVIVKGEVQRDSKGHVKTEEHDNLKKGDKPSCYTGVKRRFFQAVLGHGLFKMVTRDVVLQALYEHLRVHFDSVITLGNCERIKQAYEGMITLDGDTKQHTKTLQSLDVSDGGMALMINKVCEQLHQAYPLQFDDKEEVFIDDMKRYFTSANLMGSHFISFQSRIGLDVLLDEKIMQKNKALSHGNITANPNTVFSSKIENDLSANTTSESSAVIQP